MKVFLRVLFVIGFVFLSAHCLKLSYQLWLQPTTSVLDRFDTPTETGIKDARSIDRLLELYEEAHKEVEAYESDTTSPVLQYHQQRETEPYKQKIRLKEAIQEWERSSIEIFELRTYWMLGLGLLIGGALAYRWLDRWLGASALIVSFSEMIFWTSPAYLADRSLEVERLLVNKLAFGSITFLLLIATAWYVGAVLRRND